MTRNDFVSHNTFIDISSSGMFFNPFTSPEILDITDRSFSIYRSEFRVSIDKECDVPAVLFYLRSDYSDINLRHDDYSSAIILSGFSISKE